MKIRLVTGVALAMAPMLGVGVLLAAPALAAQTAVTVVTEPNCGDGETTMTLKYQVVTFGETVTFTPNVDGQDQPGSAVVVPEGSSANGSVSLDGFAAGTQVVVKVIIDADDSSLQETTVGTFTIPDCGQTAPPTTPAATPTPTASADANVAEAAVPTAVPAGEGPGTGGVSPLPWAVGLFVIVIGAVTGALVRERRSTS